ncbi:MAG: 50S ribosomal protein L6 [Armatimonadota bacterium]
MSRIGQKPVVVPSGVTVTVSDGNLVSVKGPKGELSQQIHPDLKVIVADGAVRIERPTEQARHRSQHGLGRTLLQNMITGVSEGYRKGLEIHGVGYRAQVTGRDLVLSLGFSHPVIITPPEGISFEVVQEERGRINRIYISGIDKQKVGQVAADIRRIRKPDPYKGKGLRYEGEVVKLKQGKRATA